MTDTRSSTATAIRAVEQRLFLLDQFAGDTAPFPNAIFANTLPHTRFMRWNGWFDSAGDYSNFQAFLQLIGSEEFCVSSPPRYNVDPLILSINADFGHYRAAIREGLGDENGQSVLLSPQVLMFDATGTWAMCHDLTNDYIIIGLSAQHVEHCDNSFGGDCFNAVDLIARMQSLEMALSDQSAKTIVANYPV